MSRSVKIAVKNIRKLIRSKHMTLTEVALLCGINPTNISKVLSGKQNLTLNTLERFADALGVKISELLEEGEIDSSSPIKREGDALLKDLKQLVDKHQPYQKKKPKK